MDKLTALGYEPDDPQGPDEICNSIQNIYDKRYSEGFQHSVANAHIEYIYHKHIDADGVEHPANYQASSPTGCFTKENIVYTSVPCNGSYSSNIHLGNLYDGMGYVGTCPKCGRGGKANKGCSGTMRVDTGGRYYTLNCGKSDSTVEQAIIKYGN